MAFLTSLLLLVTLTATAQDTRALKAEGLKQFEKRMNRENLEASIKAFEKALAAEKTDLEAYLYLIRGNFMIGEYFETDKDKKIDAYEKAVKLGDQALATNPEYKKLIDGGKGPADALQTLTKREAPVAMWRAISLGKLSKARGVMSSLKYKDEIAGMVKKVGELDPNFYYGAVPRYWGAFYAVAPGFAGGDMKKSKKSFNEALEIAPEYLGTKVLRAEVYWTEEDDKKKFREDLQSVISASEGTNKDIAPENILEKKKAEALLKKENDLF